MSGYARAAQRSAPRSAARTPRRRPTSSALRADGVLEAGIGHAAGNVPAGEGVEVIYSSAVPPENPERVAARERGLPERAARRAARRTDAR